jgi:hypothetical protein
MERTLAGSGLTPPTILAVEPAYTGVRFKSPTFQSITVEKL